MIIHVRLLHYASKFFTYSVPQDLQAKISCGILVKVPLMNRVIPAVVSQIAHCEQKYDFVIKPIHSIYPFPPDPIYSSFIDTISDYSQTDSLYFLQRLEQFLLEKERATDIVIPLESVNHAQHVSFTQEQENVYNAIAPYVHEQKHQTFLLHGVTGSGKTEIYKRLAHDAIKQGKAVVLLLPEVALALRFEKIFSVYFTQIPVIGFHSAASAPQKRLLWQYLLEQKPIIIIGVHMPILLPTAHVGLIIVDEEHDHGYQEKKHPKIHSRDMAILKANMYHIPIILGSATPSFQSLWNVKKRGWTLLSMYNRYAGNFPKVQFASLQTKKKRKYFWITDELYNAIQDRLNKKEQVIIFLNRRGYSFFVQCPCSFVFSCNQCSVSLTLHQDNSLLCHYCGYKSLIPALCPTCGVSHEEFLKKGIGTQQVVSILQKLFPQARIERADLDTTVKKRSWAQTVEEMQQGTIDILVGTQSITKGYHFSAVTLVGVLWADLNLHFPVYNAAEIALQQLIQVAGRAGRQSQESLVIVQGFDEHTIFEYIDETKYQKFYDLEIKNRIDAQYPPYKHIAEIELKGADQKIVEQDAKKLAILLQQQAQQQGFDVAVLGPIPAMIYKIKTVYCQRIFLKSFSRNTMIELFSDLKNFKMKSSVYFTIDPV
ncbi:MAG TPA: primosomal protein N' [Candidatus Saccharimonadales bacterium]|nr:primosomal protein N' [Candidatus Saccharimonadales bacterium]